ncbi:dihydrofolate reductase [Mucilaginibacter oryzae]|uniref:Dihydrofolate reductase n=1 Tax=Mucilaginibacter oryzae TaxID=468058 RepID=A0A316H2H1_9SPHI|nr:dihydrofolate reductase family protein [Mucilaginibacter oryzae]PWK69278.1 dihydrofolate reductase [Mucilaginibacter oryzae]
MRKVILNLAVSLDGFIEGPNGEYDWCFNDQDYGLTEFFNASDAIFAGRKSYELIMNTDPAMFAGIKLYVFSDTINQSPANNVEFIGSADFKERVEQIREQEGKNIWLFGGAGLVSAFIKHHLISELLLSVHPIILGAGRSLFTDINERVHLVLLGSETFSSGLIQLRYAMKPKFDLGMLEGM